MTIKNVGDYGVQTRLFFVTIINIYRFTNPNKDFSYLSFYYTSCCVTHFQKLVKEFTRCLNLFLCLQYILLISNLRSRFISLRFLEIANVFL